MQERDIAGHRLVNPLALHLHDDALAGFQGGPMHLRDGGGAERALVERGKHVAKRRGVFPLDDALHLFKGHGRHVGAQAYQLVAVGLGQHV